MDAIADGPLGTDHRSTPPPTVRTHSLRQAAPGDGLSVLPGDHPARRSVLTGSHGSRGGAGAAYGTVSLPKRQVDSEKLARCDSSYRSATIVAATSARQHTRRRVLRVRRRH